MKKLLISGSIILSMTMPVLAKQNPPKASKLERVVMLSKGDSFIESHHTLDKNEQKLIVGLEELRYQLEKDGFDRDKINQHYSRNRITLRKDIINYFTRAPESRAAARKLTYAGYRKLVGLDDKIEVAPGFFDMYRDALAEAYQEHAVPPSIVASIIGIESDFGNNRGKYPVFDALISLYLTSRRGFAYNEIKELIRFCDRNNKQLNELTASYAGAVGWAQFIPSSLNRLFIGKHGDFKADPFNIDDCIHSVAYYLKRSGWDPKNGENIREGSRNWKALLSYNKSSVYVRAVLELAESIENYISASASAKPQGVGF